MIIFHSLMFMIIAFAASAAGAVCGIGGGVIIKPALDLFGLESVATISFLSGCTVLAMSSYSVIKSLLNKEKNVDLTKVTPMAIGAAAGGVVGKELFSLISSLFVNKNMVGSIQALCLVVITAGTLLYTLNKKSIKTHNIDNVLASLLIGLVLGLMSSFLGIGGGPINLVLLFFFFSYDSKTAASNSLYIILFSQLTSFLSTVLSSKVPPFDSPTLFLMVTGGILGGAVGRKIYKNINNAAVDKLFVGLMIIIILVSLYNVYKYAYI